MLTGRTRWPRARRILFLACLWLASVSFSIIVLEWVTGYLYERTPFSNGKRIIDLYLGQQPTVRSDVKGESASLASHPYLLYTHLPNLTTDGYQQTNSLGYRNREFTGHHSSSGAGGIDDLHVAVREEPGGYVGGPPRG